MRGTVNTPFGTAMRARGLLAYDEPSLLAALDRMATEMVDSDGDGTPDIEELRMAQDPNAAPGASSTFSPTYGCHVATANGRDPVAAIGAALVALAVAAFTTRRRRR